MTDEIKNYMESGNLSCVFAILYGQTIALATRISQISRIFSEMQTPSEQITVFFEEEKADKMPKRGRPRKTDTKN